MWINPYPSAITFIKQFDGPILDQSTIGSCVQNALSATLTTMMNQAHHFSEPISRLQSYADTRDAQGTFSWDSGSVPETTLNAAATLGLAPERVWKYDLNNTYVHPTSYVYQQASGNTLTWEAVNINQSYEAVEDSIKAMLMQGKPVMLALKASAFLGAGVSGNHDVMVIGVHSTPYGDVYDFQNSWGPFWGDGGYGTVNCLFTDRTTNNFLYAEVITSYGGLDFHYTADRTAVATTYACLLKRPAEVAGLDYWAGVRHAGVADSVLADAIINSTEGQATYGHETNTQFVEDMYEHILGRTADSGGLAWWTDVLNTGMSRGTLAEYLIGAVNGSKDDIYAHLYLQNKTNLSMYISVAMQYEGGQDAVVAHEIAQVTSDVDHTEIIKIGIAHDLGWA